MKGIIERSVKNVMAKQSGATGEMNTARGSPDDNEELTKLLRETQAHIRVIGVGGSGGNTIQRMAEIGITGAET